MKTSETINQAELHNRIRSLMIVRIVVVTALLVIGILILDRTDPSFESGPIYAVIIASYVLTLIYWVLLELRISYFWLLCTQLFIDAILETALIYFSGGIFSHYTVLYGLTILSGSIFYQVAGGVWSCTWASALYALVIWLEHSGRIPSAITDKDVMPLVGSMVFLRVYLNVCFFYLIAFLSGFLSERAQRKGQEAQIATSELQRVQVNTDDILRYMSSGLITIDEEGRIISFNRAAARILGCPYQDHYENRLCSEVFVKHLKEFGDRLMRVLDKGILHDNYELWLTPATDGKSHPIGVKTTLLTQIDGEKRGVIAHFEDLTEQKRLERRMRRADRLAAVGGLSAGIAHEIRNPLASISGAVQILKEEVNLRGDSLRLLNLVIRESDRLNGIISNFLYFSRLETSNMEDVYLDILIDDMLFLIKNQPEVIEHAEQIQYQINIAPEMIVYGNKGQLEQLFLNLSLNALHAMSYVGEIRISATLETALDIVLIRFEDNGKGIPADQIDKIFEPFYTNRRGGTGLGLAIVSRIVENHRGEIRVESTPGKGTRFLIRLPTAPTTDSELDTKNTDFIYLPDGSFRSLDG